MAFMRPGVRSPSAPPESSSPFMSFFVYVLKSQLTGSSYVGHTSDLQKRVVEHNSGKSLSTKGKRPWRLVYSEEYASRSEAASRERYFKSIQGRLELKAKGIF
jgi:putative endonuclease